MLHNIILTILHLGWLLTPLPLYTLYNKQYLDQNEAHLLWVQVALLFSLMLPGWVMYTVRLVANGFFVLVVLDLCIVEFEEFLNRYQERDGDRSRSRIRRTKVFRKIAGKELFMVGYYRTMKKFKLKETFIWPLIALLWIAIRIRFTQATTYGINTVLPDGSIFEGFLITLDGWNCNYPQLTTIPLLWLLILSFCYYFLSQILTCASTDPQTTPQSYTDINGYKIYLLSHLIKPSLCILALDFGFNFVAHFMSEGLLDCYGFFQGGIFVVWVTGWGVPACIWGFFSGKVGRFSLQSEHGGSEVSNDGLEMADMRNRLLLQSPQN